MIDPSIPLSRLVNSGYWREVKFSQYGSDWDRTLDRVAGVAVTRHDPLPWKEAVAVARNYDAAIAFGYPHSLQVPSKAVQYLTLPIPRVAITSTARDDALTDYLADKPGWLCFASRLAGAGGAAARPSLPPLEHCQARPATQRGMASRGR